MVAVALWYIHTAQDQDWKRDREWEQDQWVLIYDAEMFTVVQDRDIHQDLLFPSVPVMFLVPAPVSRSVNKPLNWFGTGPTF